MFRHYINAVFQRKAPPPEQTIPQLNTQAVLHHTWLPNSKHLHKYHRLVNWANTDRVNPLYWQMCSMPMQLKLLTRDDTPFPAMGLVHLQNTNTLLRDVRADIPCEMSVRFGELTRHPKGWTFAVITHVYQRGLPCYKATSVYFHRCKISANTQDTLAFLHIEQPKENRLEQQEIIEVPANIGRAYASVSSDYNLIHLSNITAKIFGFKQAIAHGMWTLARACSGLDSANPELLTPGSHLVCEFKRPIFLPNTVCLNTNIHSQSENSNCDFEIANAQNSDQVHLYGSIKPE